MLDSKQAGCFNTDVARSLRETRQQTAKHLREQVDAITETKQYELERRVLRLPGDPWHNRGIPLVGRNMIGGAIPGTRPGEGMFGDNE